MSELTVDEIVEFRRRHADGVTAFHQAIDATVSDLSGLDEGVNKEVLQRYMNEAIERHLLIPRLELEKALKSVTREVVYSTLTTQVSLPIVGAAGALGLSVAPVIGLGAGAAVGIAAVADTARRRKEELRQDEPASDYLPSMSRELDPGSSLRRILRRIQSPGPARDQHN